jgi:alpha-beta hydrolase superfamily lysophospholipase
VQATVNNTSTTPNFDQAATMATPQEPVTSMVSSEGEPIVNTVLPATSPLTITNQHMHASPQVKEAGVSYMSWTHVADTSVVDPIFSKHRKFRTIKQWKRQVFTHCWFPTDTPPTAFMLMCHGLHEHGARYDGLMRGIVARTGIAVVGIDWPGHGRSCDEGKGPDGRMPSFHLFVHDSLALVNRVVLGNYRGSEHAGAAGDKDWYLFGHSMGGAIAINLMLERPNFFKAVCLSAPLTDATFGLPAKCVLLPLLSCLSTVSPGMSLNLGPSIGPHQLTHDLAKQDEAMNDELSVHKPVHMRLSHELVKATKVSHCLCRLFCLGLDDTRLCARVWTSVTDSDISCLRAVSESIMQSCNRSINQLIH